MSAIERGAAGFTLLELMVVLAILVLVAALLPTAFDRMMPSRRVTVASQRLLTAIRDAEADSQALGRPLRLQWEDGSLQWGSHSIGLPPGVSTVAADPTGRAISEVVVFPDGTASGTRIRVRDGTHESTVMVSGITGHARVVAQP